MDEDFVAGFEAGEDFGVAAVGVAGIDAGEHGVSTAFDEGFPIVALAEERSGGDVEDVVGMPGGDADFDAVTIAKGGGAFGRIDEIAEHDDALFLDAERGDLGEGGGFDAADAGC